MSGVIADTILAQVPRAIQVTRARALADQMTLGGVPAGSGDIMKALGRLGLRLAPMADDAEPPGADDFWDERERMDAAFNSATDTKTCPSCGATVYRLKEGGSGSWFHRRDDWGFRRACIRESR